jgi:hypothetical protein
MENSEFGGSNTIVNLQFIYVDQPNVEKKILRGVRDVGNLNLAPETDFPDGGCHGFSHSSNELEGQYFKLIHDHHLRQLPPFIIKL